MNRFLRWFRSTFEQDDFAHDWYGWATNQISHIGLGIGMALISSTIYLTVFGEFPVRWMMWFALLWSYIVNEWARGWHGFDSVEDTLFTTGYGAGGAFLLFKEVTPGDPHLVVSAADVLPLLGVSLAHLGWGCFLRR